MRRDHLKNYLIAMFTEGKLKGAPSEMARQAVTIFAEDLPLALSDLAGQVGSNLSAAALDKIGSMAAEIGKRGFRSVWADIKATYVRGVESKHGKR